MPLQPLQKSAGSVDASAIIRSPLHPSHMPPLQQSEEEQKSCCALGHCACTGTWRSIETQPRSQGTICWSPIDLGASLGLDRA
eukprot:COSAG02_NODE_6374_length_3615_cov_3.420648_6_plen_83_part_00